jgi:hypothetical protein
MEGCSYTISTDDSLDSERQQRDEGEGAALDVSSTPTPPVVSAARCRQRGAGRDRRGRRGKEGSDEPDATGSGARASGAGRRTKMTEDERRERRRQANRESGETG